MKKPFRTVAIIGLPQSGKTTLLSTLTRELEKTRGAEFQSVEALTQEAGADPRHITFALIATPQGRLEFIDAGGSGGTAAELEALCQADVALVVHLAQRDSLETLTPRLRAARQLGVGWTCVYLVDPGGRSPASVEEADACVRAASSSDTASFESLFSALCAGPQPTLDVDGPFFMKVSNLQSVQGKEVLTGSCARGRIGVGQNVEVAGVGTFPVVGVLSYGKMTDAGQAGEEVGLVLRGFTPSKTAVGAALVEPGSVPLRTSAGFELLQDPNAWTPGPMPLVTRHVVLNPTRMQSQSTRMTLTWSAPLPLAPKTGGVLHDGSRMWPVRGTD